MVYVGLFSKALKRIQLLPNKYIYVEGKRNVWGEGIFDFLNNHNSYYEEAI